MVLVGKRERKTSLEIAGLVGTIILKLSLKE
jgi:hypothetical protein